MKSLPLLLLLLACSSESPLFDDVPPPPAGSSGEAGAADSGGSSAGMAEGGTTTAGAGGATLPLGGAGAAGSPSAGSSGAGLAGSNVGGAIGASGATSSSGAGGAGTAGSAGTAGAPGVAGSSGAGGGPGPGPNACEPPTEAFRDCTGKCLAGDSCSSCGSSKDHLGDGATQYERSVVIKANAFGSCGTPFCDGTAFVFSLYAGACARFTAMPVGTSKTAPRFAQNTAGGEPRCEQWSTCLIAKGYGTVPHRLANTYVTPGNVDAWIHAEAAKLNANGSCPLTCP